MTTKPAKPKFGPNEFDTRVRERYLASGMIDEKSVEKHLHELKDVAAQSVTFELKQPALVKAGEDDSDEGEG